MPECKPEQKLTAADCEHRLEPALVEAQRRVVEARKAVTDEVERANAAKALERLETFAKRGAALDAELDDFIAEYQALSQEARDLDALGYAPTTFPLVKVNMAAAAATKLQFTDLRIAVLAPRRASKTSSA